MVKAKIVPSWGNCCLKNGRKLGEERTCVITYMVSLVNPRPVMLSVTLLCWFSVFQRGCDGVISSVTPHITSACRSGEQAAVELD